MKTMNQFFLFSMVIHACCCFFVSSHSFNNNSFTTNTTFTTCLPHQTSILLQLKTEFMFHKYESYYHLDDNSTYPKMKYWNIEGDHSDCCFWDGVSCNLATGYVISLDLSSSWLRGPLRSNSSLFRLLHLQKLNLAFNNFTECLIPSEFGRLSRLTYLNLSSSYFSGQIPYEISRLTNLIILDLSENSLFVRQRELGRLINQNMTNLRQLNLDNTNLSSAPVPKFFGNLSSLTHLSLQGCSLFGEFPKNIFQLPNIQFIRLSWNPYLNGSLPEFCSGSMLKLLDLSNTHISGKLPDSISNLKSLNFLDLSVCGFSGIVPPSLSNLSELSHLDLSFNHFNGQLPYALGNLVNLTSIYLSLNNFSGELLSSLVNLTKLEFLSLAYNNFSGQIPSSLGNLTQLKKLSLEYNSFSGQIPSTLGNLTQLESLILSNNFLDGELPRSFPHSINTIGLRNNSLTGSISSIANLTFLENLDLSYNSFTGVIPSSLFNLPSLGFLYLEYNQFTGSLNVQNISDSSGLIDLSLKRNKLTGDIPSSMFELTLLASLDLSSNDLSGRLDFGMFSALSSLEYLYLSTNRDLSITNLSTKSTLPKLIGLSLSSCKNITEFPMFLKTQTQLKSLDLSDNRIGGQIPKWFLSGGTDTVQWLNLSHNSISGWEEATLIVPWKSVVVLDLHSNKLQGPLIVPPMSTTYFSASENSLTGSIDPLFCESSGLRYLELSSNNLSGTIPQCFGNLASYLMVLNLRRNNFHGNMPETWGDGCRLSTLDLSHNQLHGKIPKSLAECKMLEILNLGHNQMSDSFPFWMQNFSKLQVLILSSNKFYGPIWRPHNFWGFSNLKIIDLSFNDFTGSLSAQYFRNWSSMAKNSDGNDYIGNYDDHEYYSMSAIYKGLEMGFIRVLGIFVCIDLSNNRFDGEIPTTIGGLRSLIVLNLSSNSFTGHIPSSMRNLTELESLDLSNNKLSGEIPQQLNSLTFLGYLNFSENQFVGPIPVGGQIGNFPNSSFMGNLGLCGRPLSKMCETPSLTPSPNNQHNDTFEDSIMCGFTWKVVAIGYGCGAAIGLVAGHIIISRRPYLMWIIFRVITQRRQRR